MDAYAVCVQYAMRLLNVQLCMFEWWIRMSKCQKQNAIFTIVLQIFFTVFGPYNQSMRCIDSIHKNIKWSQFVGVFLSATERMDSKLISHYSFVAALHGIFERNAYKLLKQQTCFACCARHFRHHTCFDFMCNLFQIEEFQRLINEWWIVHDIGRIEPQHSSWAIFLQQKIGRITYSCLVIEQIFTYDKRKEQRFMILSSLPVKT